VVSVGCQLGTSRLPFTLTATDNTTASADQLEQPDQPHKSADTSAQAGTASCSSKGSSTPCSSSHTFVSKDNEFWDVSVGVTTPGTRETKYSFSNGMVGHSITRHTDVYGMFDFFLCGSHYSKEGGCPHIDVGLPLTSQSLYRPYFGLSENLTGWTTLQKKLNLPVGISFFAGVVWMKTHYVLGDPTTQAEFDSNYRPVRVWKGLFGIEVPISSMVSKIGSKGGSSKGNSAKSNGTPSN